jgi:hypothetical protein
MAFVLTSYNTPPHDTCALFGDSKFQIQHTKVCLRGSLLKDATRFEQLREAVVFRANGSGSHPSREKVPIETDSRKNLLLEVVHFKIETLLEVVRLRKRDSRVESLARVLTAMSRPE